MNKVILVGRVTRDVEIIRGNTTYGRFSMAVDRRYRRNETEQITDFINCVAFGKIAEFLEQYGHKGTKFVVEGRLQTGSYTNKDGVKIYTTDVIVESMEFAESKKDCNWPHPVSNDGFMQIPDDIDEELPFK